MAKRWPAAAMALLATAAAGAAEAAEKAVGMPQLDASKFAPQLFWLAITFGALYWFMSRFALPRVAEVLEERRGRIAHDLDEAEQFKREAERALAEYDGAVAAARAKADALMAETRAKINADVAAARAQRDAALAEQVRRIDAEIRAAKEKALAAMAASAPEIVAILVQRLGGVAIDEAAARAALGGGAGR
jgi:F-type H+-transporting ATPase subunit b